MKLLHRILVLSLVFLSSQLSPMNHQLAFGSEKAVDQAFREPRPGYGRWHFDHEEWSSEDESEWRKFIVQMGSSTCRSVDACLKDKSANPYVTDIEQKTFYYSDCGRWPYLLRMYFSWKRNLPFSAITYKTGTPEDIAAWVEAQKQAGVENPDPDSNFPTNSSLHGNIMVRRTSLPRKLGAEENFFTSAQYIIKRVHSANYRFDSQRPMPENPDFYPVQIDRESIVPGTMIYDPAGHLVVVYEVAVNGEVKYFDAHPDNSVSRGVFNRTFQRSRPAHGAGFKNFRPFKMTHGTIEMANNAELTDFSLEQFFGTRPGPTWNAGVFEIAGSQVDYFNFVKLRLSEEAQKINPMVQFGNEMREICKSLQERVSSVAAAIAAGLSKQVHPERLPENIYSATGDWEDFSTPGRDSRLKMSLRETLLAAQEGYRRIQAGDPMYIDPGPHYFAQMETEARRVDLNCPITPLNSRGQPMTIGMLEALKRLSRISFDPYHCVERRWGAVGQELSSCVESANKAEWYEAEQVFREQIDRDLFTSTNFDLAELKRFNSQRKPITWSGDLIRILRQLQANPPRP